MARLGGMSTESFSSARERLSTASVGLGSILRDQIAAVPGTSRMNVLLGLSSSQSTTVVAASRSLLNSPAHSLSSSPVEPNGFLDVDDAAELKDEGLWGIDMNENGSTYSLEPLHRHRLPHAYDLGTKHTHSGTLSYHGYGSATHSPGQKHGFGRAHLGASKQPMNMGQLDGARSSQYHLLVDMASTSPIDTMSTNLGPVRLSPLSKVSESHSVYQRHQVNLTPTCSIPQVRKHTLHDSVLHSEAHQSAPVNVPNWPKNILQKDPTAINSYSTEKIIGEDDDIKRLPPHVMLAKEYARDQRMTSSVCEGQGRTLKGRDMRRVRNAVWRQIGFAD
ncbi:hypothetical protein GOP47_0024197 [Adiantum capillus-veneris]|uniref:Senescence regulator n=1 Tax=Adiantum capillus-veneris TaxID=13818 RepID=A0A9D4U630_ADICA|nr:hypothetical protein GOP47_0024197 [Adiantum capillus-veneris]